MSSVIEYMQEIGLTDIQRIRLYFLENDRDVIFSFVEQIDKLVYQDWSVAEYSPYSFAPSMETSGFGGCAELGCKMKRANQFIRFSSLYSDNIYLIVDSITNPFPFDRIDDDDSWYRDELIKDFSLIHLYSELIVRGIAKIIPAHFSICPDCFANHIVNDHDFLLLEPLIKDYSAKVELEITTYNHSLDYGCVTLRNLPELFPDHEGILACQSLEFSKFCEQIKSFPHIVTDSEYIQNTIREITYDRFLISKYEAFISSAYHSKYISSASSDIRLIGTTSNSTIGSLKPPVFEMPFLGNIDTKTILELRESEHHAFNDYRIALDRASKTHMVATSVNEAQDIYDDIVYPAFIKLDAVFEKVKRQNRIKNLCEAAIVASTVTLGVVTQTIPNDPSAILTAACGSGAFVNRIGSMIERKLNSKDEIDKLDFYFLWKLKGK